MDITPVVSKDKKTITGYGNGGFKINQEFVEGSLLVFADHILPWDGTLTHESLAPILDAKIELLLIGTGAQMTFVEPSLRQVFRDRGIAVEAMDTGAACRTYNIVMGEERRVAAALQAV